MASMGSIPWSPSARGAALTAASGTRRSSPPAAAGPPLGWAPSAASLAPLSPVECAGAVPPGPHAGAKRARCNHATGTRAPDAYVTTARALTTRPRATSASTTRCAFVGGSPAAACRDGNETPTSRLRWGGKWSEACSPVATAGAHVHGAATFATPAVVAPLRAPSRHLDEGRHVRLLQRARNRGRQAQRAVPRRVRRRQRRTEQLVRGRQWADMHAHRSALDSDDIVAMRRERKSQHEHGGCRVGGRHTTRCEALEQLRGGNARGGRQRELIQRLSHEHPRRKHPTDERVRRRAERMK